jgi:L-arabinose isomerase
VVGIADLGTRFRLVENEITIVAPHEPLPALPVACATWEPHPDPPAAECWLIAGGPHHTVLSTAVGTPELEAFAEMTRTELAVIDAHTAPRQFHQELHWNQRVLQVSGPL